MFEVSRRNILFKGINEEENQSRPIVKEEARLSSAGAF
jgi:hypothetical protein